MKSLLLALALFTAGASAQAGYYEPFVFRVQGSCANPHHLWFHQAAPWFRADLGRDALGRLVYADMTLQLFAGGAYWLDYTEIAVLRAYPDGSTFGEPVFHTATFGHWATNGNHLALDGLLTAVPQRIHDHGGVADGFAVGFLRPLHDPRLTGHAYLFGAVASKVGPHGMSLAQFCRP
jgi:hypothetical protein